LSDKCAIQKTVKQLFKNNIYCRVLCYGAAGVLAQRHFRFDNKKYRKAKEKGTSR